MKNLIQLLCTIVLILSLSSCGTSWVVTSPYDEIYGYEEDVTINVIQTRSQLDWRLRRDYTFANNYYTFLQYQNYSFFHDQYFRNRLYRYGWYSPHDYWLNWQWSWNTNYAYWNPYNAYPWYGNWNTNYWWNYQSNYSYIYGPRTSYLGNVYGRNNIRHNIYKPRPKTDASRIYVKPNSSHNTRPNNTKPVIRTQPPVYTKPSNTKPVIRTKPPVNTRPPQINNRPIGNTKPPTSRPPVKTRSSNKRGGNPR